MKVEELFETDTSTANIARVAKSCHNANKKFCQSIGDDSQPDWDEAEQWQKDSAIAGVKSIVDNPSITPEESHNNWKKMKLDDGWKYGPVKDTKKKEHPCIVDSYDDLPEDQRKKDEIFINTAKEGLGIKS